MSRYLNERLQIIERLRQAANNVLEMGIAPGTYSQDDEYRSMINGQLAPRTRSVGFYLTKYNDSELLEEYESTQQIPGDAYAIVETYKSHLTPIILDKLKGEEQRIRRLYQLAAQRVAKQFATVLGSTNWKDLLSPYLPQRHSAGDKYTGIVWALTYKLDRFNDALLRVLNAHNVTEHNRHLINDRLKGIGLELRANNQLIEVDANLGLADIFGIVAEELLKKVASGDISQANFDIFEYHRPRVADAYYRLDWKAFGSELRHILEAYAKCLSKWDGNVEFKMEAGLQGVYGTKAWQTNTLYAAYRILSNEGGHSGVPDKKLCLIAFNLMREVMGFEYGLAS